MIVQTADDGISVLVVDDSFVQCQHAVELCRQIIGGKMYQAGNGVEALQSLARGRVNIMIVDLEMPIMDGVELISQVASENLVEAVIIVSAKDISLISSVGEMAQADGLQVLGTLQKPLTETDLRACLDVYVSAQQPLGRGEGPREDVSARDLATAIAESSITMHYQPKLTTQGLKFSGVEALARWEHPARGFISPEVFIGAAEAGGEIGALTMCLLRVALGAKQKWLSQGLDVKLAFNLSPSMLIKSHFANWFSEYIEYSHINPESITLEVTENVLLGQVGKGLMNLARLRLKGFPVSIDDYGSGFASAEQLARVPATELKIDRVLVDGVADRPAKRAILDSTIKLAHQLNLSTVAEGVERFEDYQVLADMGVDMVQGYYFARPMPARELLRWVRQDLPLLRKNLVDFK